MPTQLPLFSRQGREEITVAAIPATSYAIVVAGKYGCGPRRGQSVPVGRLLNLDTGRIHQGIFGAFDNHSRALAKENQLDLGRMFPASEIMARFAALPEFGAEAEDRERLETVVSILGEWPYFPGQLFTAVDVCFHSLSLELLEERCRLIKIKAYLEAFLDNREVFWAEVETLLDGLRLAPFIDLREPVATVARKVEAWEPLEFAFRNQGQDDAVHRIIDDVIDYLRYIEFEGIRFRFDEAWRSLARFRRQKPKLDGRRHFYSVLERNKGDFFAFASVNRQTRVTSLARDILTRLAKIVSDISDGLDSTKLALRYGQVCKMMKQIGELL